MGPFKALLPFAKGFLRLTVLVFAFTFYFEAFKSFDVRTLHWFIATLYIIFALLLFVGGFSNNATLSVIAGFIIFAISAWEIFKRFKGLDTGLSLFLFSAAIGLYFVARGNKG